MHKRLTSTLLVALFACVLAGCGEKNAAADSQPAQGKGQNKEIGNTMKPLRQL